MPNAHELADRLVRRGLLPEDAHDPAAAAVQGATEHLYRELSRWLGVAGCQAVLTRALLNAQREHPVLEGMRIVGDAEPRLDGIEAIQERQGSRAVAEGLHALLVALLELLGRLLGEDMVVQLVQGSLRDEVRGDASNERRRAREQS
ncbi:MAG: hypothetical protein ACT4O1_17005 [Gemmatimonadota bacterium]